MKKMSAFIPICLLLAACGESPKPAEINYRDAIGQMQWLKGTWQGEYEGKPFHEKWVQVNDTLLQNYALKTESDTAWAHNGQIRVMDQQVYYTNEPKGDEKLLKWVLTEVDNQHIRLENPTAPYSRTIVFSNTSDGEWKAELTMNGKTLTHLLKRTELPDYQIINQ